MSTAIDLPLRFTQSLLINAAFPIPSSSARRLFPPDTPIHLIEVFPRRSVLVVSFALYRESPFGPYAETTLALMASHEPTTPVMTLATLTQESRYPAYVLHMLVNNEQARAAGSATWSLPRTLADVTITEEEQRTVCTAAQDERMIVELSVDRPPLDRTRTAQIESYSMRDTTLLRTVMSYQAGAYSRLQGGGATLAWGPHPIGQHFAQARPSTMPLMIRYYDQVQAEMHAPEECAVS